MNKITMAPLPSAIGEACVFQLTDQLSNLGRHSLDLLLAFGA
ncbi:MAG: hypothetical protein N838_21665 [Thiohalocapsa sp. PB-PSB1]|nr:MAG: hypothetical protein N838_21665 [Thiohalocapsa sp. PB-PSB1]